MAIDYKSAGVDVERGYKAVELMKKYVQKTYNNNVMGDIGSFGGAYSLDDKPDGDVLIAGTDGVGTKLKYAFVLDKHDTIGIDCVAMCVNDIICQGAKPLFFLDYIATSKLIPERIAEIVKGIAEGCIMAGAALIGGETAEMPSFYEGDDYDMAGFSVGIAKKDKLITGDKIESGDKLIGLRSSGLHSNGYSLVRKLFPPYASDLNEYSDRLGCTYGEAILEPTRIYVKPVLELINKFEIKGLAHITGGGFIENIPRMFKKGKGLTAKIDITSYEVPVIYSLIQERAILPYSKMYNTFNMGIGMVMAVSPDIADEVVSMANALGEQAYIIGEVINGEELEL